MTENQHLKVWLNFRAVCLCAVGPRARSAFAAGAILLVACSAASAQVSLRTVVEMAQRHSDSVHLAQADVQKAVASLAESRDVFIPSISFGSGLPLFPEVGFTGNLPTIWDASVQSLAFSMGQIRYVEAAGMGLRAAELSLKDSKEQVALDASTEYIELDAVNHELQAAHQQEDDANRMVTIEQQRAEAGVDPLVQLLQAQLTAAQIKLNRLHLETRAATLAKQISRAHRTAGSVDRSRPLQHSGDSRRHGRPGAAAHRVSRFCGDAGALQSADRQRGRGAHLDTNLGFWPAL